jgi:hypothetical protein
MTDKCIHCGHNPTREDSAHIEKISSEYYDINQIKAGDDWLNKNFLEPNIKSGKIPVSIEWYSDGSRKIIVMEKGWSEFVLEEMDRHGKGIRDEICAKLAATISEEDKKCHTQN